MPTNSVTKAYAEWLATPPATGVLVETVQFSSPAMTADLRICNRRDSPMQAKDETGVLHVYEPVAFEIGKPSIRNSTEMEVSLRVDGVDGSLFRMLTEMNPDDVRKILTATVRVFVDPIMLDRPVWLSPLRFRVEQAKVGLDVVDMSLVGGRLPNKRAGRYYDMSRFVGLRPF